MYQDITQLKYFYSWQLWFELMTFISKSPYAADDMSKSVKIPAISLRGFINCLVGGHSKVLLNLTATMLNNVRVLINITRAWITRGSQAINITLNFRRRDLQSLSNQDCELIALMNKAHLALAHSLTLIHSHSLAHTPHATSSSNVYYHVSRA